MITVTVARRPVVESTVAAGVLSVGCGAIAVDRCRIGLAGSEAEGGRPSPCGSDGNVHRTHGAVYGAPTSGTNFDPVQGRWPTNVVLEHTPHCTLSGVKKVKGTGERPAGAGARFKDAGSLYSRPDKEGARTPHSGFSDEGGMETIASWDCDPSCPVWTLDEQSGESRSSGFGGRVIVKRRTGKDGDGNAHGKYGAESRSEGSVMTTHDDQGGASRFFKQVGSVESVLKENNHE